MTDAAPTPTVFIVDDDPSVLKALGRLLRSAGLNVAAYASATQFLEQRTHPLVGCLVLDVTMPDLSGPQLQQRLNQSASLLPILFLTGDGDLPTGIRAMKAGAVDFLTKPCPDQVLLDAIHNALATGQARQAKQDEARAIAARFAALTPREHDVMRGVVAGHANKRIATDLGMAEATVKIHRGRLMTKLGVDSLADLVRLTERAKMNQKHR